WRQPLNVISFGLMNIKKNSKGQEKNLETIKKLNEQVQYMSHTIEDFRNFYNPSKVKEEFGIYQAIKNSHTIASTTLEKHQISFSIEVKKDFTLYGHQNELEQVILNIINNAKDALINSHTQTPTVAITVDEPMITIEDNGGGIKKEHLSKIFNPYFSTKEGGDGIGLYLSTMIIEKELEGKIWVESFQHKTTFFIKF
ncbi:MAG: HAMP domain-containing histidine kinase, partial [Sulfurovaceae bacterium]|nr:HAMP domain-containing histidine kinase [Sulfurovaceae bacterium]